MLAKTHITGQLIAVSRFLNTDTWHKRPHISALEGLPVELLQCIASHLPLSAAASFALSSKYIWYVVGSQYWHHLRFNSRQYKTFLGFLEKSMPGHWLCDECLTFHPKPKFGSLMRYSWLPAWKCAQPKIYFSRHLETPYAAPYIPISHIMLRMAMNRHLFGPEHGEPLKSLSTPAFSDSFREGLGYVSTEACIVADELYMRCQVRIAIPSSKDFRYIMLLSVCPHISTSNRKNPMTPIIQCLLNHRNTASCEKCKGLRQCRYCLTEFNIQISRFGSTDHVLEVTYWKNFGAGRSINDPMWTQQLRSSGRSCAAIFSPGCLQAAFESEINKIQKYKSVSRFKRVLGRVCVALEKLRK